MLLVCTVVWILEGLLREDDDTLRDFLVVFLVDRLDLTVQVAVLGEETVLGDESDDISFFFPITSVTCELGADQEVV